MIPVDDNVQAVPARLFVAVMAIERIARDLCWHFALPAAAVASTSARSRTLLLDCFPAYDQLADVYIACKRLLATLEPALDVESVRCAGELVMRAETAVLVAHVAALHAELEEMSRPEPQFLQRVRDVHERVRARAKDIESLWTLKPTTRAGDGHFLDWTPSDYDAYRGVLDAVQSSLKALKADAALHVMTLVGLKYPNDTVVTTCRLIEVVLDFSFEPDILGRLSRASQR